MAEALGLNGNEQRKRQRHESQGELSAHGPATDARERLEAPNMQCVNAPRQTIETPSLMCATAL